MEGSQAIQILDLIVDNYPAGSLALYGITNKVLYIMKQTFTALLFILFLLQGCKNEDLSDVAGIADFQISQVSPSGLVPDTVVVDNPSQTISLLFAENIPSESFPVSFVADFGLTAGARSSPASGTAFTINNRDDYGLLTLTAEDGSKYEYGIVLRDDQIPNSGFEDWYTTSGMDSRSYEEPGMDARSTVWATANYGTSMYSVYCTKPLADGDNTLAQIKTGETSLIPITAGTLFNGRFDVDGAISNPTNPRKAVAFGIPFTLRPTAFRFRYTYQPGERYIQATLKNPSNLFGGFNINDLQGGDMFAAYAVLEAREGSQVTEIGKAEINSGAAQDVFQELTVPFVYSSNKKPTHIYVVFTSSKDGDLFTGAVGSTLTVDDLELVY